MWTHWGSEQKIVERILKQELAIQQVFGPNRRCSHLISMWLDVDVLQSIHAVLNPWTDYTDMLWGKEYVETSAVW